MNTAQREAELDRLVRITEIPLILLSFVMIPLLIGPLLWEMSETQEFVFLVLDGLIWAVFAVDLAVKFTVAPRKLAFLRSHWATVLVVLLPFARPLRLLRLILFMTRAARGIHRLMNMNFLLVYAVGLIIISATVATSAEQGQGTIESFPDALWWSIVTATTVGYGDISPVTPLGRGVAVVLMLGGIGLFGALTANLASVLVRSEDNVEAGVNELLKQVRELRERFDEAQLAAARQAAQATQSGQSGTSAGGAAPGRGFSLRGIANIIRGRLAGATSRARGRRHASVSPRPDAQAESRGEHMPDAQTFRQAWGRFATGVSIVTTLTPDGEVHGMTANGINSVSLDPLLVLVCAGHTTTSYPMIQESGRFAISILAEDQRDIAEYYARPTDQKTGDLDFTLSQTDRGSAFVDGSLAQMDCKVVTEHVAGDHTIFIGEVEEINVADGRPLLFFQGSFSRIE